MKWIALILIISIFSAAGFWLGNNLQMRSLPEDIFEKTDHFIPEGYADEYWDDSGWQDGFHISYYELSEKEIAKLESEIKSENNSEASSLWKPFSGAALNYFEKKIAWRSIYDDIKNEHFRNGTFYYCSCEGFSKNYAYFDPLSDDPNVIYLDRSTWFFIYNSDAGKYYVVQEW